MATTRILQSLATLDRGGAEVMIMTIYRNLDHKQIQFDFLVNENTQPYAFEKEVEQLGGRVFKIPKFNGHNLRSYRRKIEQLFQKHPEWGLVHIHNISSAMLFMDLAKKYHIETIAHAHFDNDTLNIKSSVQKILRRPIKNHTPHLLACSELAGAYGFHIKKEEVRVFKNAIETEDFLFDEQIRRVKRDELGANHEIILGHVGRMDTEKNHDYLIDIFQVYHQINPKSLLVLIGTGPLQEMLEIKVANAGLKEHVHFLGVRADVHEWLQAMDIFIFPSFSEGLPVTLIEAQAAGLPIIASDTITTDVKVTGLMTFRSIEADPFRWANKIDDLLVLYRDNMREEMVNAGYDVKSTVRELQDYYLSILKDGD